MESTLPDIPTVATELPDVPTGAENLPTSPDIPTEATELPDIPTEATGLGNLPMFRDHHSYINVVSSGVLCPYVIFTSNFNTVKTELKSHVALYGPKGCGKSLYLL